MEKPSLKKDVQERLHQKAIASMKVLCSEIPNRSLGSKGNNLATDFFVKEVRSSGWIMETTVFDVIDWKNQGTKLFVNGLHLEAFASPYSLGCDVSGTLISASNVKDLQHLDLTDKIILLHDDITKEALMPKNFIFYNPDEHKKIIRLLEQSQLKAIICATKNTLPLIEDGDFDIPSVYMSAKEGKELLNFLGQEVNLLSKSKRIPAKARNVIARNKNVGGNRIVLTAHIDSAKGTPGALDNATGVTTLILLADLLSDYQDNEVEIVAFNGEDYYSTPGQMLYWSENQGKLDHIILNINIDGIGYKEGKTAFSFFGLPDDIEEKILDQMNSYEKTKQGIQWPQGDHSMFVQAGRPAIAITSQWILDHIYTQNITHSPKDNLDVVNYDRIVETALIINSFVRTL